MYLVFFAHFNVQKTQFFHKKNSENRYFSVF